MRAGPPHPHARADSTWVADPKGPPRGRAAGGGGAPELRRPSQRRKASPPGGRPFATPTARNDGPQGHTLWGRCWVPTPTPTAPGTHGSRNPGRPPPRDGQRGEGARPTPDAPHRDGRPPPRDGFPLPQQHAAPRTACKPRGQCWAPTSAHPRPQHAGSGPRQPPQRRAAGGGRAPDLRRPSQRGCPCHTGNGGSD